MIYQSPAPISAPRKKKEPHRRCGSLFDAGSFYARISTQFFRRIS